MILVQDAGPDDITTLMLDNSRSAKLALVPCSAESRSRRSIVWYTIFMKRGWPGAVAIVYW